MVSPCAQQYNYHWDGVVFSDPQRNNTTRDVALINLAQLYLSDPTTGALQDRVTTANAALNHLHQVLHNFNILLNKDVAEEWASSTTPLCFVLQLTNWINETAKIPEEENRIISTDLETLNVMLIGINPATRNDSLETVRGYKAMVNEFRVDDREAASEPEYTAGGGMGDAADSAYVAGAGAPLAARELSDDEVQQLSFTLQDLTTDTPAKRALYAAIDSFNSILADREEELPNWAVWLNEFASDGTGYEGRIGWTVEETILTIQERKGI